VERPRACYELTEPVRQQRGEEGSFYHHLTSVREGQVDTQCMKYFNARQRTHLQDDADRAAFRNIMDPGLLVLCCFGQDRQRINMEYFRTWARLLARTSTGTRPTWMIVNPSDAAAAAANRVAGSSQRRRQQRRHAARHRRSAREVAGKCAVSPPGVVEVWGGGGWRGAQRTT
jgi:hypothetical protein